MGGLDRARRELDDALVVPRAGALLVLVGGQAEQQHAGDAERGGLAGLLDGAVDREVVDAGHATGSGVAALAAAGDDEHRVDRGARPTARSRAPARAATPVLRRRRRRVAGKAMR